MNPKTVVGGQFLFPSHSGGDDEESRIGICRSRNRLKIAGCVSDRRCVENFTQAEARRTEAIRPIPFPPKSDWQGLCLRKNCSRRVGRRGLETAGGIPRRTGVSENGHIQGPAEGMVLIGGRAIIFEIWSKRHS